VTEHALSDVKVAALVQGVTGPQTASMLAAYGATVLRIETRTRIEWHRQAGPFIGNKSLPDNSGAYLAVNPGLLGFTLNLKHPRAPLVWEKIVRWADVIVENFAGGVMDRMGMGYSDLIRIKPDIILLSAAIFGQTGPYKEVPGFGGTLTSITGLAQITGFPDQLPQFPGFAITDFIAPRTNVIAIMSALEYRRRTGKGQLLDAAQMESVIPMLSPVLLQYDANGVEAGRLGNRSSFCAPHGVYRCKGDNRWCAIAVEDENQWRSFCVALGKDDWVESEIFGTLLLRLRHIDQLDQLVEDWTLQHTPEEVQDLLQSVGVPASVVKGGADVNEDPQLKHRGYYWEIEHPDIGIFKYTGMPAKMSETPYSINRAPLLGEHTEMVCTKYLGLTDNEFVELLSEGVFE